MYKEDQVIDDYLSGRIGTASFLEIICTVSDYYMNIWDTIDRMEGCLMCDFTSDRWRIPAAVDL